MCRLAYNIAGQHQYQKIDSQFLGGGAGAVGGGGGGGGVGGVVGRGGGVGGVIDHDVGENVESDVGGLTARLAL